MVAATEVPSASVVRRLLPQADYADAYTVRLAAPPPSALHAYLQVMARTPTWIDALMAIRNAAVRLLALKDVGRLADVPPPSAAASLQPGDRVGIFTIRSITPDEAVFEILDSHLDVVLSVVRDAAEPARMTVSTLVFYHNRIGWLYMVPVAPMHRIVVRSTLSTVEAR